MIQLFKPRLETEEIFDELKPIMNEGWIGLGPKTQKFENIISNYVGSKYSVGVNSCTSALHLALKVAGIKKGDKVITTPMTFVSTNHAILYQGAEPFFWDIDENLHIDVDSLYTQVSSGINESIKAIMVVHYGGLPVNMKQIYEIAEKYNLWVIEDAAHALGAEYFPGVKVGSNPYKKSLTVFSFHAVKNLPTPDGGMITTNSKEIYERLKKLRWMGIDKDTYVRTETNEGKGYNWLYNVEEVGYKYHMNDVTACFGIVGMKHIAEYQKKRKEMWEFYSDNIDLNNDKIFGIVGDHDDSRISSYLTFTLRVKDRDDLIQKLNRSDIYPGVHYYPNNLYDVYKRNDKYLPNTMKYWKQIILLPFHLYLKEKQQKHICEIINQGW